MGAKPGTTEERFWRYAVKSDGGCWEWRGALQRNASYRTSHCAGYGILNVRTAGGSRSSEKAHRISWNIHYGSIPDGMCVLHRCDNRTCTNPDHLFLGTRADNSADMVIKNRHRGGAGERNPGAKLTAKQVEEIRAFPRGNPTAADLAQRYGISRAQVYDIRSGRAWPKEGQPLRHRRKKAAERRAQLIATRPDLGGP